MFDPFEALELLEALVRVARKVADTKADEYAAVLDEVRARNRNLPPASLHRLLLGLLGDPIRAKIAKESATILKGIGKAPAVGQAAFRQYPQFPRRDGPYGEVSARCFRCQQFGHYARNCRRGRARPR